MINGKNYRTHRLAYQLYVGNITHGKIIMHRCDNPPCINPDHLQLGIPRDNSADMIRKGRSAYGEKHSQAKLSKPQVKCIREMLKQGINQSIIGKSMGIHQSNVSRIANGEAWTK